MCIVSSSICSITGRFSSVVAVQNIVFNEPPQQNNINHPDDRKSDTQKIEVHGGHPITVPEHSESNPCYGENAKDEEESKIEYAVHLVERVLKTNACYLH